jgi:hypothetical protein
VFYHRSTSFEQANHQENLMFIIGALVLNKQTGKSIGCLIIDALKGYINKPMAKRIRCSLIGTII